MKIEGLRSPYVKTGGIYYFARMIDKVRLHAAGKLGPEYVENLGTGFDGRCCAFLKISYEVFRDRVQQGGSDEELLAWAVTQGYRPSEGDVEIWNDFMRKRGWNDEAAGRLALRIRESVFEGRSDILTMFDYIDADEGRVPGAGS